MSVTWTESEYRAYLDRRTRSKNTTGGSKNTTGGYVGLTDSVSYGSEAELQAACVAWCWSHADVRLHSTYAVPNESDGSRAYTIQQMRRGLRSGVSDLVIPVPSGDFAHLYVELKHGTNDLTASQQRFLEEMHALGSAVAVVHTLVLFKALVTEYLTDPYAFVSGI